MADVSARLPRKISIDLTRSLGASVRLSGSLDPVLQRKIKSASDDLERTLKNYDRVAEELNSSTPLKEQLEQVIQDRVPQGYRDKAYKRLFWRTVYKVVPFLQQKKKTEDQINALSRMALTVLSVLFRSIISYTNQLVRAAGMDSQESDATDKDPEGFDPELDSAISGLEHAVKPSEGKDQFQRKTDQNVKRQESKATPTPGSKNHEEYVDFIGKNNGKINDCKVAVERHNEEISELLKNATDRCFHLIQVSAIKAVALGQVLNSAATASKEALQPGTYIACRSILTAITSINTIVIQSVASNRAQRAEINKRLKQLQKQEEQAATPASDAEEV